MDTQRRDQHGEFHCMCECLEVSDAVKLADLLNAQHEGATT